MLLIHFRLAILSIFFISFINPGNAQVGTLNKDFGNDGYIDVNLSDTIYSGDLYPEQIVKDSFGNMYIAGIYDSKIITIVKKTATGKADLLFGNKGSLEITTGIKDNDFGYVLLMQIDSKENIYLIHNNTETAFLTVLKYNRFGQIDLSFGMNGKLILNGNYAADFKKVGTDLYVSTTNTIVKFNQNGLFNNSFGTNGISSPSFDSPYGNPTFGDIVINSEGYLYISTQYLNYACLVKLDQTGAFVNSFGTNGVVMLPDLWRSQKIVLDNQERILIHHDNSYSSSAITINTIYRYLNSGLPDPSFGTNGAFSISLPSYSSTTLYDMTTDTNDNIYISGNGQMSSTSQESLLIKINATGTGYDPSFNSDGIMNFIYENLSNIEYLFINTNGTISASCYISLGAGKTLAKTVLINPSGVIIDSFSSALNNINSNDSASHGIMDSQGNLYILGYLPNSYPILASINPEGNLNQTFGDNGKKIYTPKTFSLNRVLIERNGDIYSAGVSYPGDPSLNRNAITKTDKNGNLIASFGVNGILTFQSNTTNTQVFELLFDQDSSLLLFSNYIDNTSILITKITRNGSVDLSYGNQGSLLISTNTSLYGNKAVLGNTGSIYISGKADISDIFTAKISNQAIDPLFGLNGFVIRSLPNIYPTYPTCSAMGFDSNGNLVLSGFYGSALNGPNSLLFKLSPTGEAIPEFGSSGFVTLPYTTFAPQDLILDENDNIFIFGNTSPDGNTYAVAKTNASGQVDNNGLVIVSTGWYKGVIYDKKRKVAYLYGTDWNNFSTPRTTDVRIVCLQLEDVNFNTISGTVFQDANASCDQQQTEQGINNIVVVAQPGNNYSMTDASGSYTLKVDTGSYQYTVKQLLNPIQKQLYVNTCTDTYTVPLSGSEKTVSNINFADKLNPQTCPLLYVDVQNTTRRRCYPGVTKIKYANYGTASESNVTIVITYPEYTIAKKSTPVWQSQVSNTLTYNIGILNPGQEGYITIADSVLCLNESVLGFTQCVKAEILPVQNCLIDPAWDHSEIVISESCGSDSLTFSIKNIGTGDMDVSRNFYVFVNDTIIYSSPFLLESQKAVLIKYPANGKTIRVSAEQDAKFPFPSNPSITTNGCSSATIINPIHTSETNLPVDDQSFHVAYSCLPIVGSFDPNHKSVSPSGYGDQHYVNSKDKLTYTIQFQNVGSDTAFKVVIKDTLDINLDISTLLVESASHPFTYTLSGRGNPALQFSFDPIVLRDSTSNLLKSEGFVTYSIYPKIDISEGAKLMNKAYIYFDYNSPIITNETMLTIRNGYNQDLSKDHGVSARINVTTSNISPSNNTILIYPNPAKDYIHIRTSSVSLKKIELINISGTSILKENISGNDSIIKINSIVPGIYFYLISDENDTMTQGKLIIE
jgi:uncharacterized delta-60 repeat protein/uncharacterized repeat protein (TIGR01451 family)